MTQYIKDGIIYNNLTSIKLNGRQIINPKESQILAAGYEKYTPSEESLSLEITLESAINDKLAQITEYDNSDNINLCYYGETSFWLDKATRVGLVNSTTMEKQVGRTTTKLILGDLSFVFPVDTVLNMLAQLEVYAKDCYDNTAQHKINVKALTTVEEVEAYDYTVGYPDKLNFGE